MTKVKVSEEYYVNYGRHRPLRREREGEGKPEREKGLQSRCHHDAGPPAPIPRHLSSPRQLAHLLCGLHSVTKEEKLSALARLQPKVALGLTATDTSGQGGNFEEGDRSTSVCQW